MEVDSNTKPTNALREGSAEILPPSGAGGSTSSSSTSNSGNAKTNGTNASNGPSQQQVFYNPAQVFNRDFSILVCNVFSEIRKEEEKQKEAKYRQKELNRQQNLAAKSNGTAATAASSSSSSQQKTPNQQSGYEYPEYKGLKILEGLSASGLRSIRYINEIKDVDYIVCNDFDATAVKHIGTNLDHNKIDKENKVKPNHDDVNRHLYLNPKIYDVVDLDPYGTASPFLDAAIKGIQSGGLLCVTSTDMPILGGNHPETCFYRYGGTALKSRYIHEMSLRLLLNAIASTAARHQRYVEPLISCSIDFYVRIFLRVYDSPLRSKELASKTGLVYQCCQCECFHIQPLGDLEYPKPKQQKDNKNNSPNGNSNGTTGTAQNQSQQNQNNNKYQAPSKYKVPKARPQIGSTCSECDNGRYSIGGPFYLGRLYNQDFLAKCIKICGKNVGNETQNGNEQRMGEVDQDIEQFKHLTSWRKILGMLTAMNEEILADVQDIPLHYQLPALCSALNLNCMPQKQYKGCLQKLGYKVGHFHREPSAIKTDAPPSVVYDILRKWNQLNKKEQQSSSSSTQGQGQAENKDNNNKETSKQQPEQQQQMSHRKQKKQQFNQIAEAILKKPVTTKEIDEITDFSRMADYYTDVHSISLGHENTESLKRSMEDLKDQEPNSNKGDNQSKNSEERAKRFEGEERPKKIPRFLPNPEKNWGPKPRAKPEKK